MLFADPLWPWLGPPLVVLLCYVLPILWMMSRLATVYGYSSVAILGRSLMSMNALLEFEFSVQTS